MASRSRNRRKEKRKRKEDLFFDYTLLFIVLFLIIFGLVMLYSTSSYTATLKNNDPAFYLKKQLLATLLGFVAMFIVAKLDYHWLDRIPFLAYGVAIVTILLIKTPLGRTINGARRWIYIGPISIQPAEIAKIAIILVTASLIKKMGTRTDNPRSFWLVVGLAALPAAMVLFITSNLSSAIIIGGIAVFMFFVSDPTMKKYWIMIGIGIVGVAALVVYFQGKLEENSMAGNYRGARFMAWLDPERFAATEGFQTLQALYAIGSGGVWGKGLGNSMQKLGFLPEAQNDMVFSIICEELGLFGAACVIVLFAMLIWRCMVVATNAPDIYGALLAIGVMGHFAIQVILNIAVVTNSMPNTGITLPFISYGGTSIVFLLSEIGLVLSVSRQIRLNDVG